MRDALLQDEDFYRFQMTLESYAVALEPGTIVVTEAKSGELLEYLLGPPKLPPE